MRKNDTGKRLAVILVLVITMTLGVFTKVPGSVFCVFAEDNPVVSCETDLEQINEFGNITLVKDGKPVEPAVFEKAGIEYGDVVSVSFLDQSIDMPVVKDYNEVDNGVALMLFHEDSTIIAIFMGSFADKYIADKSNFEDQTYAWTYKKGIDGPVRIDISLKTKGGMYEEFGSNHLTYTDERSDYPELSDEEFANFRVVETTGMGKKLLYRTASPVNPIHKRNSYADAAIKKAGVKTVINLSDTEEGVKAFEGYDATYYATTEYIALNMGVDFYSEEFNDKLAEGLKFMASHKGPYAVHCTEGKDRAGITIAVLECLMGASYDEVTSDYMLSFYNYYGITPDDEKYDEIVEENIAAQLKKIYDIEDPGTADLAKEAEEYLKETGLSDAEIKALKANLSDSKANPALLIALAAAVILIIAAGTGILIAKKRAHG